jgi:hypothetical protein
MDLEQTKSDRNMDLKQAKSLLNVRLQGADDKLGQILDQGI